MSGNRLGQKQLELAVSDHLVERVYAGRVHADKNVPWTDMRFRKLAGPQSSWAISVDDKCSHARSNGQLQRLLASGPRGTPSEESAASHLRL